MKVAIGCDHAGLNLKAAVRHALQERGDQVADVGTEGKESVDYPDFAHALARKISAGECERGVLVCGTGIGMAITANKVHGVRAAVCSTEFEARAAREHNDANVLCLGERVIGTGLALSILQVFLETPFEGGRHARRVQKIEEA
jgi:ribose 5-phosphate isomerase B